MTVYDRPQRLASLDVLRGLTVAGMILVNSMAAMKWGAEATIHPLLLHVSWDGLALADLVFPGFLMMVGVAIPLAFAGGGANPGPILARSTRLFLVGVLLSNLGWLADFSSGSFRLFGVLQRIGLVYCACALLYLWCTARTRMIVVLLLLLLYWPLALLPSIDGLPTNIWERGHNFVASVDRVLLGAGDHIYVKGPEGYDPEGVLGTLPAIAQGLIGVAIGEYMQRRQHGTTRRLVLAGLAMTAAGVVWGLVFPVVKDIWSSSFVLITSGITTLVLAGLHAWIDGPGPQGIIARVVTLFGTAFGINAIAAYVLHQLSAPVPTWQVFLLPFQALRGPLGDTAAAFVPVLLYMGVIWIVVDYLRRKRWIVKI